MVKTKKNIDTKLVKSVNKNIRSSVRKLKPILKSIVGKKVDIAIRDLSFSDKRISKDIKKTIMKPYSNLTIILTEKAKQTESHGSKS